MTTNPIHLPYVLPQELERAPIDCPECEGIGVFGTTRHRIGRPPECEDCEGTGHILCTRCGEEAQVRGSEHGHCWDCKLRWDAEDKWVNYAPKERLHRARDLLNDLLKFGGTRIPEAIYRDTLALTEMLGEVLK